MDRDAYQIFTQAHRVYMRGIRNAISERLKSAYGDDWWQRGVLSAIGDNQRVNLEREMEKGIPADVAQLLDTPHFARIVERHHAVAFADAFTSIDYTLALFRYLSAKRNEWAHVRDGEWTSPDIMQAVQAMREILMSLRRKEALEIHRMFQDSLDQQGKIPEETLNLPEESSSDGDDDSSAAEYPLLGLWRTLESYLVIESIVQPSSEEEQSRGLANVLVRVTNTAPASEGRPDVRFRNVMLETMGAENHNRQSRNRPELGNLEPGQTIEREFTFASNGLASVEFRVFGEVDQDRLFQVKRQNTLPDEVVTPLLEQLGSQFEAVGIEEALDKVVGTVSRIQPAMTLAEVSDLRRELAELKPLIAEKREALGALFGEYHLTRESSLGIPLREVILLLGDLERNKISAMDSAISETDLESIRSVAHDFEQLQISVLRTKETIRERIGSRRM